jgi:hypothetical protein
VSPVKYELDSYIPENDILHSLRRENLESYKYTTNPPEPGIIKGEWLSGLGRNLLY